MDAHIYTYMISYDQSYMILYDYYNILEYIYIYTYIHTYIYIYIYDRDLSIRLGIIVFGWILTDLNVETVVWYCLFPFWIFPFPAVLPLPL